MWDFSGLTPGLGLSLVSGNKRSIITTGAYSFTRISSSAIRAFEPVKGADFGRFSPRVCQTCFGGIIWADKKDPLSIIRAELNSLAVHIAKNRNNAVVKGKLREIAGQLQELAARS